MNLSEITQEQYNDIFPVPYHIFNSVKFNELNKYKCEQVNYLLFQDKKKRLGLIIGRNNNSVSSPFSAPFGCFSFKDEQIDIKIIEKSIRVLDFYIREKKISSIKFILPPLCYNISFLSKLINALKRNDYNILYIDLNHIFKTSFLDENYINKIYHNARKNLNIALKENLSFIKTEDINLVYNIISENRKTRGLPLMMTFEQVRETINIIKYDAFVVKFDNDYIASALIYHVAEKIVQVIYWGDIPEFSSKKTMNFLSYKVFEFYKKAGIEIIDIGPSSQFGIPNYGLCDFKESIGCLIDSKFIFNKNILNIDFVNYTRVFLDKSWEWLNDKEIRELTMTPEFTKEQQETFFLSLPQRENYFIKGIKFNDKPIGACGLKNITENCGEYWGYIGEKEFWGQGIGKEIVKYIVTVAEEKGLKSIWLNVSQNNERAKNLYLKFGFYVETINDDKIIMRYNI